MSAARMVLLICSLALVFSVSNTSEAVEKKEDHAAAKLSPQTQACIGCHIKVTPGIIEDWRISRHSFTTPEKALTKPALQRRISAETVPSELKEYAIGCYECHSLNPERHQDNFQHMGYRINVIVSPNDCNTCHPVEVKQYSGSKKGHAWKNIMSNPLYHTLVSTIDGLKTLENGKIIMQPPTPHTLQETCLGCHGTKVEVKGMK